jgi:hypothetical protein
MKALESLNAIKMAAVFGLVILTGAQAFAKDDEEAQIPRDATVLYQVTWDQNSENTVEKSAVLNQMIADIQSKESSIDIEYKCQAVYYKWNMDRSIKCYRGSGWGLGGCINPFNQVFGSSKFYTGTHASVTAYCAPRSYDQKIVLGLERRCEENPTAECLDEKIKSAIATIQHTVRYDINKPE